MTRYLPRKPRLPMIFQAESSECGLACLAMVAGYHGHSTTVAELRKNHPISLRGITLRDLLLIAERIGLSGRPVRCDMAGIRHLKRPALLHWDLEHFVVLNRIRNRWYYLHDPARGELRMNAEEVSKHFTGIALEVATTPSFEPGEHARNLGFLDVLRSSKSLHASLFAILFYTTFVELFSLAAPAATKIIVDSGIPSGDGSFIRTAFLGAMVVVLFHGLCALIRDYSAVQVGARFNYHMLTGMVSRMLTLPLPFFEKRHAYDLVDRYQATNYLRDLFVSVGPIMILDGVFASISLVIVFLLSPILGLISLAALIAHGLIRLMLFHRIQTASERVVYSRAEEQGAIIETLRSILPIKAMGREDQRQLLWFQRHVTYLNAEHARARLSALIATSRQVILGSDLAISLYVGTLGVLQEQLTLGTFFGIMMYKSLFSMKAANLADQLIQFQLRVVYLERLSDIALAEPETNALRSVRPGRYRGRVTFDGVSFRYSSSDPDVLRDAELRIEPGEFVAICGGSGVGKTTMVKLLLGLYAPTKGRILIDDFAVDKVHPQLHRRQFGVVMQGDALLSGTIAENIAFFDPVIDTDKVIRCAKIACIHDEISGMAMKYNSRVTDTHAALSGGQRQRIMIARADNAYKGPYVS